MRSLNDSNQVSSFYSSTGVLGVHMLPGLVKLKQGFGANHAVFIGFNSVHYHAVKVVSDLSCHIGPVCNAQPPIAVRITTSQAGVFQNTSKVKAARARPKSAADNIALVQTGS